MIKFSLVNSKIQSLEMRREDNEKDDFNIKIETGFSEEDNTGFIVIFKSTILSSFGYILDVEYASFFKTEDHITDEFKTSLVPSVNAPAIAYPFFRAFVSTLVLNAGYNPIILPPINFQALAREQKKHRNE